jgi:hypothetical protein
MSIAVEHERFILTATLRRATILSTERRGKLQDAIFVSSGGIS